MRNTGAGQALAPITRSYDPGWLPALISGAGDRARYRFTEFFAARIRNKNTRQAYAQAIRQFFEWCDEHGFALEHLNPVIVSAYVEQHPAAAPTVKQHLAALKMLFDWLVIGQVLSSNPASSVRGPKHVVKKGKTPVLTPEETRQLLESIDTSTLVGLRDRALIALFVYTFSRVSAAVGLRVQDYYIQGRRSWVRLHEKGSKIHEVPVHHVLDEALETYIKAAGIAG
ncbi:MAG: tyrosine-type recombinase/integrase [Acidobacteriaceae bacterium]|nr:tyrosine-type recombinase/integrase [Acidobacteriaceae bacterium]